MKTPKLLACLAAAWLAGGLVSADISIVGGRMTNPGSQPFKAAETVGAFVERIGGIKPTVVDGVDKPWPSPITKLRILRDGRWGDTYSIRRDATHLWNHELKDGDLIELLTIGMLAEKDVPKWQNWQGAYRDEWTIRIPKPPVAVAEKIFPSSAFDSEAGYRKMLMEAFPGLELGCYHFSGKHMMGVLEDFDHDRVLLLLRPSANEKVRGVTINGKAFDPAGAVPVGVKGSGMTCVADDLWVDDPTRIEEEPIGHWIPMEATDRFAVRIQSLFPDRGLFIARYDPDDGWSSAYELSDAEKPKEVKPPADAYELTRKSLLARVLQVLEQKPECVVRKRNDIDLKLARPPEGFWEDEVEPMQVRLADRRGGESRVKSTRQAGAWRSRKLEHLTHPSLRGATVRSGLIHKCNPARAAHLANTSSFAVFGAKGAISMRLSPGLSSFVTSSRNGRPMNPPAALPLMVTVAASSGEMASSSR
jgi:hypothetical protein